MAAREQFPAPHGKPAGTLTEQVYGRLEAMIVTLELPPGTLLSELAISRQFGVSRTPVGEALQQLAREGLVTILQRRGFVVTEIHATDQLRLLELRREIARFIARSGAARAAMQEREALREVAHDFLKAAKNRDETGMTGADKRFHDLFADCAHNNVAEMAMEPLDALSRRFSHAHRMMSDDAMRSAQLHAAIALAMADGDEKRAVRAADALADYLEEFVRSTLDRPPVLARQSGRR
jgi:DNA-binding GntR family transcriptional regulator